jgi:hypothetical protein
MAELVEKQRIHQRNQEVAMWDAGIVPGVYEGLET